MSIYKLDLTSAQPSSGLRFTRNGFFMGCAIIEGRKEQLRFLPAIHFQYLSRKHKIIVPGFTKVTKDGFLKRDANFDAIGAFDSNGGYDCILVFYENVIGLEEFLHRILSKSVEKEKAKYERIFPKLSDEEMEKAYQEKLYLMRAQRDYADRC